MQDNEEVTHIDYEYGDLYIGCSCGHKTLIKNAKGIRWGIRFDLYTINTSQISLECEECKHKMFLYFEEAEDIIKLKEEAAIKEAEENAAYIKAVEEAGLLQEAEVVKEENINDEFNGNPETGGYSTGEYQDNTGELDRESVEAR